MILCDFAIFIKSYFRAIWNARFKFSCKIETQRVPNCLHCSNWSLQDSDNTLLAKSIYFQTRIRFQSEIHFLAAFPYVSTDPSFCCYAFSEAVHDSRKHPPGLTASNLLPQQFKPPNPSHLHQSLPTFSLRSLPSRAALKTTFLNSRPVAAILKSFKFDSLTSSRPQNPSLRSKLC